SVMSKAMDLTVPLKYSLTLNMRASQEGKKKGAPVCPRRMPASPVLRPGSDPVRAVRGLRGRSVRGVQLEACGGEGRQGQRQQAGDVARIVDAAVLGAAELQAGDLQGA